MPSATAPALEVAAPGPAPEMTVAPDLSERAALVYDRLRPELNTPENLGKMLIIEVDSGDYELSETKGSGTEANLRLQARHPRTPLYGIRIGYRTAEAFGGGMERETDEKTDWDALIAKALKP